jgi:regulatory protein
MTRRGAEPPNSGSTTLDGAPDPESVARAIALRLLASAPRSRAQLAEAIAGRDVPEDVARAVLDRFTEVGLIDDAAYAQTLVRSRHADRGLSRRALGEELRRKGIAVDVASEALAALDADTELETARRLVERKLAATAGLDTQTRIRRTVATLARKGYPPGVVLALIRDQLAGEGILSSLSDGSDDGQEAEGG